HVRAAVPRTAAAVEDDLAIVRQVRDRLFEQREAFGLRAWTGVNGSRNAVAAVQHVGADLQDHRFGLETGGQLLRLNERHVRGQRGGDSGGEDEDRSLHALYFSASRRALPSTYASARVGGMAGSDL